MSKHASFVAALCSFLLIFGFFTTTAFGQCSLSGPVSTWNDGTGNWSNGSDWVGGVPNSSTQSVCITNGTMGAPSVVNLNIDASINDLQLGTFDTLNFEAGTQLEVFGTQIINAGQININSGGGSNALLELANNVTLSGAGTLTLANTGGGGTAIIYQAAGGLTLTNQSTIDGAGTIGFNGLSLINQGTVNANTSGQTLEFSSMTNGINNAGGLLQASNGGTLLIDGITVAGGGTITASGGGIVQLIGNTDIVGGTLNNIGGTLGTPNGNAAILDGSTAAGAITINGTYTNGVGSTTYILGTINNKNNFQLNAGGGANSALIIDSANVTLQGGGTVTMSNSGGGGTALIYQESGGSTLTNVNNTIQGAGTIGFNGLSVVNEATIDANVSGQTLTLVSMTNGLNNTGGLLEASNGGTLYIDGVTVNNTGANITANAGSTVQLVGNTTIQGGTLTNNGTFFGTPDGNGAILDGSTGAGAITINGTYTNGVGSNTYILGTINNNNNFQLNAGGGSNSGLLIDSANVTLQGGGTLTLSNSGGGGSAIIYQAAGGLTLTNVNNTIQGTGIIGFNGLTVVNEATIDANVSGQTLFLESMTGGLTNTGMLEASNGGTLNIDGVTVNNAGGGTITANAGSTVLLLGNTTIQGGTLTNNGTFFGTPDGNSAILDGSTAAGAITINGTYTNGNGSTTYILGTINNNNNFLVTAAGNGNNSELLIDSANVTLQGGGTVTLSTASGGGNALLLQAAGGLTLTNVNNTIQGEGVIGFNGLTLVNEVGGTINANSTGGSLINTLTIESASVTNQGLIEATNNGVLNIDAITVKNQGGTIAANGASATVQLYGNADIQGGTLTNNGGNFFGTPNGNVATLDGSTVSGAVTINGTYTNGNNSTTFLLGTINNQGNILLDGGSGNNSDLEIDSGTVTLKGGGTVTMSTASGGGNAIILQAAGGLTLENFNNTIQGAGLIGDNGLSLLNDAGGTILANAPGQTLFLDNIVTLTNNGTFQANAGSVLLVEATTNFTNFSGNTLTGGTYNVIAGPSGTAAIQINNFGNTGGEVVNNAATILLDGPGSSFVDMAGKNALSNFSNNEAAGSFTIQDGRNFTGPNNVNFANAGIVNIGAGSTFATGGTGDYNQSGGSTQLNGMLTAGGGTANFNGGVLFGNGGVINGNVMMGGTIVPAGSIGAMNMPITAGMLTINGNYTQTAGGIFNLGLGGLGAGTQFGLLSISGNATLDGTLNVSLINGFFPTSGDVFKFLTTGGTVTNEFANANGLNIGGGLQLDVIYGSNFVELTTMALTNTDLWLGGTGNWSNGSKWSIGVPTPPDNVTIYSGGNDLVTLNVGSTTISSLAVGGPTNGFTSELTDGGVAQTLTITNGLTIGQQGVLDFTGSGSSISAATVTNDGSVTIGKGATLNLTNQPNGVTDVALGASWTIGGNFEVGGVANTGFANLASIEGTVNLQNGASQSIGNALTIASGGFLDLNNGTTLNLMAGLSNSGSINLGKTSGGNTLDITGNVLNDGGIGLFGANDTLSISGTLTNNGSGGLGGLALVAAGDKATMSGLTNNLGIEVDNGGTLQVNGDATNNGTILIGTNSSSGPNILNITGMLTNNGSGLGGLYVGFKTTATIGGDLLNPGDVDLDFGGTLKVDGDVTNSGTITTNLLGSGVGGNTYTIMGMLTNSGMFELLGPGDMASIGNGLTNSGTVDLENGSTLAITGNTSNSGNFYTDFSGGGGNNTVTITGTLDNTGLVWLRGAGDSATITGNVTNELDAELFLFGGSKATMPGLTNAGTVDVEGGSTLQVNGDSSNSGNLYANQQGNGGGNSINITGTLTNSGNFELFGPGDMATLGGLTNPGTTDVEHGSTLQINGNATNSGDFYTDFSGLGGNNTVNITGTLDNTGLVWLKGAGDKATITGLVTNELDAEIFLVGGSKATMNGGLNNAGTVDVEGGSTLQVNGDATNSGNLYTNQQGDGGMNTVNITGMLTNSGNLELFGPKDTATIGSLTNNAGGFVDVEGGSRLNITGDVTNNAGGPQGIYTSFNGTGGNTLSIGGTLTNNGMVGIESTGDMLTVTGNVTNNNGATIAFTGGSMGAFQSNLTNNVGGTVDLENASTLTIMGNADNSGTLGTSLFNGTGGNSLNIDGTLTNSGIFAITGHLDSAAVASITNNSGGLIDLERGSSLSVAGNVTNSGEFDTSDLGQGGGNVVIVNGSFTNNSGGLLQLLALKDQVTLGSLTNNAGGFVDVENGATLTVNGDVTNNAGGGGKNGIFTTYNTIAGNGGATIDITGTLTNSGTFQLNGPGDMASIGNGATNSATGTIDVEGGSTLNITGDVTNDGELFTGLHNAGINNVLNITGTLTNSGSFGTRSHGDVATLGGLDNSGSADVEDGSKLQINGDATNSGTILTSSLGGSSHDTLNITGNFTNSGTFELEGVGDMVSIGGNLSNNSGLFGAFANGSKVAITGNVTNATDFEMFNGALGTIGGDLTNSGIVDVEKGSTLQIAGNVTNSGSMYTAEFGQGGGNAITITGVLTNEAGAQFTLNGPGDMAVFGGLVNLNTGSVAVEGGSTLSITGDATNSGFFGGTGFPGGDTLKISGNLVNNNAGIFALFGPGDLATIGGSLSNSGGVDVENGSTLNITGALTNNESFLISGALGSTTTAGSLLNAAGAEVDVDGGSTLQINGAATNFGTIETNGGGNTMIFNGLLTNTATGTITLNGPGDVLSALAGLTNSGVINVNNGSSILPPTFNNLGTLNIDGTSRFVVGTPTPMGGQGYIQTANGVLGEMIASMNSFGVINVNGSALLNGTLDVLLQGGYNPGVGSMYKFLNFTPGDLSGMFANIPANGMFTSDGEQWMITYDNADGYVELTAEGRQVVSEPGTLLVLIPGLLGMGYGLRRRLLK